MRRRGTRTSTHETRDKVSPAKWHTRLGARSCLKKISIDSIDRVLILYLYSRFLYHLYVYVIYTFRSRHRDRGRDASFRSVELQGTQLSTEKDIRSLRTPFRHCATGNRNEDNFRAKFMRDGYGRTESFPFLSGASRITKFAIGRYVSGHRARELGDASL